MSNIDDTLVWLVVGGTPRSGTTALGEALGQSNEIALFHEYLSPFFFAALERFFVEEDRQKSYLDFPMYAHMIPTREAHGKKFARSIFRDVFPDKKSPRFIGTKSPNYEGFPVAEYPAWITPRTIHITRNPFDTLLSSLKKDIHEEKKSDGKVTTDDLREHLWRWVRSWNHAVKHADDSNFLHIFYEDLLEDSLTEKRRVTEFLDGVRDFDFSGFKPTQTQPFEERYSGADMAEYLNIIKGVTSSTNWLEQAKVKFQRREKLGLPLKFGEPLSLTLAEKASAQYVYEGFYQPEPNGCWTRGKTNTIVFSPVGFENKPMALSFELVWSANNDRVARDVEVFLNDVSIFRKSFKHTIRNGQARTITIPIDNPAIRFQAMQACSLTFLVHNPLRPSELVKLGVKKTDVRSLGIMIRNIVFSEKSLRRKLFPF